MIEQRRKTMATVSEPPRDTEVYYPDSDRHFCGRGESAIHFRNISYLVGKLDIHFANDPQVYVGGNMFIYFVEGDQRRHLSPDVFVVRGIAKEPPRRRYLTWEEGKGPDFVLEVTSESTREEDLDGKMRLYREELRVPEYFLFDPLDEYLRPRLQGYRLVGDQYEPIVEQDGRLPSAVLGLHLEAEGPLLRLYDPSTGHWLPTPPELHAALQRAEAEWQRAEAERQRAEAERQRAEAERQRAEEARAREAESRRQAEAEVERLRQELEDLRRRRPDNGGPPG
jgi:Uma2 family endonuclease